MILEDLVPEDATRRTREQATDVAFPSHVKARYVLGEHSGRALIGRLLTERGRAHNDNVLGACLTRTESLAIQRRPLSPGELVEVRS